MIAFGGLAVWRSVFVAATASGVRGERPDPRVSVN